MRGGKCANFGVYFTQNNICKRVTIRCMDTSKCAQNTFYKEL